MHFHIDILTSDLKISSSINQNSDQIIFIVIFFLIRLGAHAYSCDMGPFTNDVIRRVGGLGVFSK